MEQHSVQTADNNPSDPSQLKVGVVGFNAADEESFNRFFQVARVGQRKYVTANDVSGCPIILVNYDNPSALEEQAKILASSPQIQVVAVSKGPLNDTPPYHIRGMLFAARVLTTLDKVALSQPATKESVQAFARTYCASP
jgi:two-component system, cell cycle response regulator